MVDAPATTPLEIKQPGIPNGKCRLKNCGKPLPPATPKTRHQKYCCPAHRLRAFFDKQIGKEVKRQIDIRAKRKKRAEARKLREAAKLNSAALHDLMSVQRGSTRAALPETKKGKAAGVTNLKKNRGGRK